MKNHINIADIITFMSLAFGFGTLTGIVLGRSYAVWLLLGSIICDFADGWIARTWGMSSMRGQYFDALCDACNFSFVPAMVRMLTMTGTRNTHESMIYVVFGVIASFFYCCCGIYRLARYLLTNIDNIHVKISAYQGLPVTAASMIFVCRFGVGPNLGQTVFLLGGSLLFCVLGYFMVSSYKIPKI